MNILQIAKEKAKDGFTWQELGELFTIFLQMSVKDLIKVSISGPEKKALVLAGVGELFDIVAPAIPLPVWLTPFRVWMRPYFKQIVLLISDGAIEAIYQKVTSE